ncbi:MAG: hypothetical protein KTR16_14190 [Acidiferrobacterales bacterium]|nr:hypothetical protein [Acidiferrobacterales bacterium]
MTSIATLGGTPKSKAVRIENAISKWHFSDNNYGSITVDSFAHIDPIRPTPAWLANRLLVSSPNKTMTKMKDILEAGAYSDAEMFF